MPLVWSVAVHSKAQPVYTVSPLGMGANSEWALDVAHLPNGRLAYVGVVSTVDSAVVTCVQHNGTISWRKAYHLGSFCLFNSVLVHNGLITAVGIGDVPATAGSRLVMVQMNENGDHLWTKYYHLPASQIWPQRFMLANDGYAVCGYLVDPQWNVPRANGFILQTTLAGDSLSYTQYADTDSFNVRFVGMALTEDDALAPVAFKFKDGLTRHVELIGPEPDHQTLWVSDDRTTAWATGGLSDGERQQATDMELYAIRTVDEGLADVLVHESVMLSGAQTTEVYADVLEGNRYVSALGHVSYAQLQLAVLVRREVNGSNVSYSHQMLALDSNKQVFWHYETPLFDNTQGYAGMDVGMSLDSIKGIVCVAGNVSDGPTTVHPSLTCIDLTQLQNMLSVAGSGSASAHANVYPNPTAHRLYVSLGSECANGSELRLYDLSGQLLMNTRWHREGIVVDQYAAGIYFIEYEQCNGLTTRQTVVLE